MKLIVGLGNPGAEYAGNRHNLGFMVVDELARQADANWSKASQANALIAKINLEGEDLVLAKPQTFMNLSGPAVQALAGFYKIEPDNIWVIHDELDLPFGVMRVRTSGDSAGHNGLKSIIESLGTHGFGRFRIGIANEALRSPIPPEAFVLQNFRDIEKATLNEIITGTTKSVLDALSGGLAHHDLQLVSPQPEV